MVIIESAEHALARGATIQAELIGAALTADAFHISAPEPTGRGACMAMTKAMQDAGVAPDEVDYIAAHGTSTSLNDVTETRAIKAAFGGARAQGADQLDQVDGRPHDRRGRRDQRLCRDRRDPRGRHRADDQSRRARPPECDLDYVPLKARQAKVDTAIINGFGFGGQNAVAVFRRFEP